MTKAKKGDVRPVYQQVGWEVCKVEADKPENEEWTPTEKDSEAEILSDIYKRKSED